MADIEVHDNDAAARYEITVDGRLGGYVQYEDRGEQRVFVHTEVDDAFEGQGLGSQLAVGALDDARAQGKRVVPRCPFIKKFIGRHPEYEDLVDAPEV